MEFAQLIFSDFWHFIGFTFLFLGTIIVFGEAVADIIRALKCD